MDQVDNYKTELLKPKQVYILTDQKEFMVQSNA